MVVCLAALSSRQHVAIGPSRLCSVGSGPRDRYVTRLRMWIVPRTPRPSLVGPRPVGIKGPAVGGAYYDHLRVGSSAGRRPTSPLSGGTQQEKRYARKTPRTYDLGHMAAVLRPARAAARLAGPTRAASRLTGETGRPPAPRQL